MAANFGGTGLNDTPRLYEAYQLSYDAFNESFRNKYGALPKKMFDQLLQAIGSDGLDDLHKKTVLRMALLMQDSGVVSEPAIAASMLYKAAKDAPSIMRKVDSGTAGYIEKMIKFEKRLEAGLMEDLPAIIENESDDIDQMLSDSFAKALTGQGAMSLEEATLMKIYAITAMELLENTLGDEVWAIGRGISHATAGQPSTPVDDLFKETLERVEARLHKPETKGAGFPRKNIA